MEKEKYEHSNLEPNFISKIFKWFSKTKSEAIFNFYLKIIRIYTIYINL